MSGTRRIMFGVRGRGEIPGLSTTRPRVSKTPNLAEYTQQATDTTKGKSPPKTGKATR
jgi:hypothetical protein